MLNISVGGDAEGGHLVNVHDGETNTVQRPEGVQTDVEAFVAAVKSHGGKLWDDMKAAWAGDVDAVKAELAAAKSRIAELEKTAAQATQATKSASTPTVSSTKA